MWYFLEGACLNSLLQVVIQLIFMGSPFSVLPEDIFVHDSIALILCLQRKKLSRLTPRFLWPKPPQPHHEVWWWGKQYQSGQFTNQSWALVAPTEKRPKRTCLELLEHTASNIPVNNESGRVTISPYIQGGCVVSQVLGSNAVLCKAVVLFCEVSGSCVLVVCLLLGTWIVTQNRTKKYFPEQ